MTRGPDPFKNAALCTQCGYCLPACPTYRADNNEFQSPRGRVSVVLALKNNDLTPLEARDALGHCLVCRACHNACPAGVRPAKLVLNARGLTPLSPPLFSRLFHWITGSHRLTARAAALIAWYQRSGWQHRLRRGGWLRRLPGLARLEAWIPEARDPLPSRPVGPSSSGGEKGRIGLLSGCMGRLFLPDITPAAATVLTRLGFEVVILARFGCCGAPYRESGLRRAFLRQARRVFDEYRAAGPLQAVVCDSGACAVTVRSYGRVLAQAFPDQADAAQAFADKAHDLSGFLARHTDLATRRLADPGLGALTHHDHCQTRHGLGIMAEPRVLLSALPVPFRELPRADQCCGAGGDYTLRHPGSSGDILKDKTAAIIESGADTVVGDNPGCLLNMAAGLRGAGDPVRVRHLAEVLCAALHPPHNHNHNQDTKVTPS